jgi:predicted esterase
MPSQPAPFQGPHQGQPVYSMGAPLEEAHTAMVMLHGRGATAHDILTLASQFEQEGVAYLAPQAQGYTWYPNRFLAPLASNQPYLDSALVLVGDVVKRVIEANIPAEKIILLGFSQGACLALEFAARNAQRYGAVIGLTGGLIGSDDEEHDYPGEFAGTPIFLGSSDVDPHIPLARVHLTERVLQGMGAHVRTEIYPNMGHLVSWDEIEIVQEMLQTVAG